MDHADPLPSSQAETLTALYDEAAARLDSRLAFVRKPLPHRHEWKGVSPNATDAPDLITSCLTLQKASDLAGELNAIHAALAKGGLFLGVLIGEQSFHELRACLMEAEVELSGGASLRVPALPDAASLSRHLTAAGFSLPVVDRERVTLVFDDLSALMHELRAAGCTNHHAERPRRFTPRALFERAAALYTARFPAPDGGITATIDFIFLHGWRE